MPNILKPFFFLIAAFSMLFMYACEETTFNEGPFISKRKQLISFAFNDLALPSTANVNEESQTITARLPFGTDLTNLSPTIAISEKATVTPPSGISNDFSDTTTYIITAENGTTQIYDVIITVSEPDAESRLVLGQPMWNLSQSGSGVPTFFTADGERGLAYGNNHVYVTNNNDKILILNRSTGAQEGLLNTENLEGGSPKIADVEVSDDGTILACNSVEFTSDAGGESTTFKIYKWSDEAAALEEFITYTNTEYRMGDSFSVIGDISTNAVILTTFGRKFLNPATRGNLIFRWNVVNGVPDTEPTIITVQGVPSLTKFGSRPHAEMLDVNDTSYFVNANDIDFTKVGLNGGFEVRIPNGSRQLYDGFNSHFEIFQFAGKTVIATAFPRSASESRLLVIDITEGLGSVTTDDVIFSQDFVTGGEIANVNAGGAVAVNIVSQNLVEIYCLITNQALVKFELTTELVQ
jgi:hypothetical protein